VARAAKYGATIDRHHTILRINQVRSRTSPTTNADVCVELFRWRHSRVSLSFHLPPLYIPWMTDRSPQTIDSSSETRQNAPQPFPSISLQFHVPVPRLKSTFVSFMMAYDAQGPTWKYEKYVGSRTSFRLLAKKWVALYTERESGRHTLLPAELPNATLLVSRVGAVEYEHLASLTRRVRPDVKVCSHAAPSDNLHCLSWVRV
jgi:hypothetical protein